MVETPERRWPRLSHRPVTARIASLTFALA